MENGVFEDKVFEPNSHSFASSRSLVVGKRGWYLRICLNCELVVMQSALTFQGLYSQGVQ